MVRATRQTRTQGQEPGSRATEAKSIPAAETFFTKTSGILAALDLAGAGDRIETVTQPRVAKPGPRSHNETMVP